MPEAPEGAKQAGQAKSRLELIRADKGEQYSPAMPPLEAGEHVIELLWEVGPTLGDAPLTHGEIRAYQDNAGVELSEWEARTLRRLSIEYLNESHHAAKRDRRPPWLESPEGRMLAVKDAKSAWRAVAAL